MSIFVAIRHTTHYQYDKLVSLSPHVVRLRPAPHCRTPIEAYTLKITPAKHFVNWQQDPFGNYLARLVFPEKCRELTVDVEVLADMTVINPFDFFVESYAEEYPFEYPTGLSQDLTPYREIIEDGPLLHAWLASFERPKTRVIDFLVNLNQRLWRDISYLIRLETGVQTCEETLRVRSGSCRDSAWLLVQIARHLGLAARFVSGYLVQLTADQKALDGPSGPEQDFTDLHAWAEVYIPGAGWVGLDPTSGLFAGEGHIPLAATPAPESAAPVTGYSDPCIVDFQYSNTVSRIRETPRVTKPYTEDDWQLIVATGKLIDTHLTAEDVRLTMGGEPTFVSIDDMESAQWNTDALGDHKRERAERLMQNLRQQYAPNGLLHYGQGKWYPGEPLPRWALTLIWREDGQPVWTKPELLADPTRNYNFDQRHAYALASRISQQLGIDTRYVQTGYEDHLYYLWQETQIPIDLDADHAAPDDPATRRSLAAKLSRGLDTPVGYALPIGWDWTNSRWFSGTWQFRRQRLYLVPGDSPMGLRLPLDALPWATTEQREQHHAHDPFDTHPPLADYTGEISQRYTVWVGEPELHPEIHEQSWADATTAGTAPHTALCIEARDGCLFVFLPPLHTVEHFLNLVANVEAAAANLGYPLVFEGYAAPRDPRLLSLSVTPDPGVIEVNIHPTTCWEELVRNTELLYEQARLARLGTEKFMLDGRHTGTGGGNHVTLGGPTAADSPFLRRPDLLRSLITYWQHHPSLSYLFSGLFIGPTSQAPRVDESRLERLYELEIAFQQTPQGEVPQPWLVDRLFRNLLVDITGNTHRSEFCIDKLYSPDSAHGRQGLVEFRAFEMPPHHRMSSVQMLLIRALVARFWKHPYVHGLVRWGTELHDRFLLPHYVWRDFYEVIGELRDTGYPLRADWFLPFFEFRFPHYGAVQLGDIQIELRAAIEPWHVLGEETTNLGTARFVDSSVERIEVHVRGMTTDRHVLVCNGRRVPLRNTGEHGQYVAGVRYRAWQPPSALHPYIPPQSPLVFDLVDTWNGRSVGGCTYHVMHPGGRSYNTFPVNAFEAEARRITRFWGWGHTPGVLSPPPETQLLSRFLPQGYGPGPMPTPPQEVNPEYPYTLDLRRRPT